MSQLETVEGYKIHIPPIELSPYWSRRKKTMVKASPWLTLNDRDSWHRRKRLTLHYREAAVLAASEAGIPAMKKAHITYWVSYGSNRVLDPHNYMLTAKAIIDGLVKDYKMLPDDDSKYLIGPDPRRDESLPIGMTLVILDLGLSDGP